MKCELCHKIDAACAITRETEDGEEELYVCSACAKSEKLRRKAKSQHTRKVVELSPDMSVSITESSSNDGDEEPPPFIGAIMSALNDMVSDLEKIGGRSGKREQKEKKVSELPMGNVETEYQICDHLHLEGLHLIGELDAVKRALHALDMDIVGISADALMEAGHAYKIIYKCSSSRAKQVAEDIVREEKNARARLRDEMQRVFGDSLCRALAVLKNCRLLGTDELFDLLSPLRLAAICGMVDGITRDEIERMMADAEAQKHQPGMSQDEQDRIDAERADEINRRFEGVMLDDVF